MKQPQRKSKEQQASDNSKHCRTSPRIVVDGMRPFSLLLALTLQSHSRVWVRNVTQDASICIDQVVGGNDANLGTCSDSTLKDHLRRQNCTWEFPNANDVLPTP